MTEGLSKYQLSIAKLTRPAVSLLRMRWQEDVDSMDDVMFHFNKLLEALDKYISSEGKECEACDGLGLFFPAEPSCDLSRAIKPNEKVVERCDSCEQFPDDLAAALTISNTARWIVCKSGGEHAVVEVDENTKE